jgi:hypothetical protein
VRAAGIERVEQSLASVDAMRSIFVRRRLRAAEGSPILSQIDGILQALNSIQDPEIGMLHFVARDGREGIILTGQLGSPLFAYSLPKFKE